MAYDKVVDSAQLEAAITASADAIREKTGDTASIQWLADKGFAEAIAAIEAGGVNFNEYYTVVTGTIIPTENITSNYTIDSGLTFGDIPDGGVITGSQGYKKLAFLLFFDGLVSDATILNGSWMTVLAQYMEALSTYSLGHYRSATGAYKTAASSGEVGRWPSNIADRYSITFRLVCSKTPMLLAGVSYRYIFFIKKDE